MSALGGRELLDPYENDRYQTCLARGLEIHLLLLVVKTRSLHFQAVVTEGQASLPWDGSAELMIDIKCRVAGIRFHAHARLDGLLRKLEGDHLSLPGRDRDLSSDR